MRELTPQEFALAIAIVVSHRRTCITRRQRTQTAYIDDCLAILELEAMNPKVRRFTTSGILRARDARRAEVCEETRAIYESIALVVRQMTRELEAADRKRQTRARPERRLSVETV